MTEGGSFFPDWVTAILLWLAASLPGQAAATAPPLTCVGALVQGGLVVCETEPGMRVEIDGLARLTADKDGLAVFGLPRDAPDRLDAIARAPSGAETRQALAIATRKDDVRWLEGLDCDKVDARSPEQKAHAGRSWEKKVAAFASFHAGIGPAAGFVRPAEGRASSPFGPTRHYSGVSAITGEPCEKTSVHRGYDIAAPVGTDVIAPAPGIVILADPDLYYEGGTIFLDHGHGLVSVFMHLSEIAVATGDAVETGLRIGAVGNTGRTTGPHLHWAIKWRNPESADRGGDFYVDPALLLDLPARSGRTPEP